VDEKAKKVQVIDKRDRKGVSWEWKARKC